MIPFNDLRPLQLQLAEQIQQAIGRVLASGRYVLDREVAAFESELAHWTGLPHAVGLASGTDAVELAVRAAGIRPGDEVILPAFTAVATVVGIARAGAVPVLADVDPQTLTLAPAAVPAAISPRTAAIMAVHLYGQLADLPALHALAQRHNLALLEDAAQALGASDEHAAIGRFSHAAALSFYPTKNLGACGDGGAVLSAHHDVAQRVRQLRFYGQDAQRQAQQPGLNSRLDELQAAILRAKLPHLREHLAERRRLAALYDQHLHGVQTPVVRPGAWHTYHLYVVRHPRRQALAAALAARGIGTHVHYPWPIHGHPAYTHLGRQAADLSASETAAREVLSLPLYPGLAEAQVVEVARNVAQCAAEIK